MGDFFNSNAEFIHDFPTRSDVTVLNTIPRCKPPTGTSSCLSIAYVPSCPLLDPIIEVITSESSLPPSHVMSFDSLEDLDDYVLQNPNTTQFAYVFHDLDSSSSSFDFSIPINYSIVLNTSAWVCVGDSLGCRLDYVNGIYATAKQVMDQHIMKAVHGSEVLISTSFKRSVHPKLAAVDVFSMFGRSIVFFIYLINSVTLLSNLVGEKESGIKMYLRLSSMKDVPYYGSHIFSAVFTFILLTISFYIMGYVFDLKMYTNTSVSILFIHFLLVSIQVTVFTLLISVFFRSTRAAVLSGFAILFLSFIGNAIVVNLFIEEISPTLRTLFSYYPTVAPELGMFILAVVSTATGRSTGMTWDDIDTVFRVSVHSLLDSWKFMIRNSLICFILAWYLDNILPTGCNHRRPFYFPFTSSYWTGKPSQVPDISKISHPEGRIIHQDVAKEREIVMNADPNDFPVLIKRLHKKFGKFVAVEDLCLSVAQNETMCLLGPNGAGKTTAIKSCVSLDKPTGGAAFILGHPVGGIPCRDLLRNIGYCPQFDCLFDQLTFKEHLILYANMKGISTKDAKIEAEKLLKSVKLSDAADKLSSEGSGGMKRRLSIAISLVGNPKFLVLDEPSTGLDIKVRANIWEIISSIKKDRAILMTTHSMEEAEQLATRVSIMCHSRLWAVGTSLALRNSFGSGYKIALELEEDSDLGSLKEVLELFPNSGIVLSSVNATSLIFEAPQQSLRVLPEFLKHLESNKNSLRFKDFDVHLSTLKDVFIDFRDKSDAQFVIDNPEFAGKITNRSE
ncbi:hypothetical protein RCL1_007767 [Eukaryota sp. TZLM3-RCL]